MFSSRRSFALATGAALLSSSFALGQPAIEEGRPTLINRSGSAVLADELITDDQLRERLESLQSGLASEYATQDALTQLLDRLIRMENTIQQLRGDVELLNERLRRAEEQNRERYLDLDRRLTSVQAAEASGEQPLVEEPPDSESVNNPEEAESDYRAARSLIAEREYEEAISAFADFIEAYPDSGLVSDALFWQGEVHTLMGEYDNARQVYQRVVSDYPDAPKRSDALFKLGFVSEREGDTEQAIDYYSDVVDSVPDSSLAELARQRLDRLSDE